MLVALLSCGPSLRYFPGPRGFGAIIAVNKAAQIGAATHWSVGDAHTFCRLYPALGYHPLLWTHVDTYRQVSRRFACVDAELYERSEVVPNRWSMFSATAALWLAGRLGASRVQCFGCDMCGELNWDGTAEAAANRTETRWQMERVIWEKTVNLLEERGIEVVRA
jgi:hypothetical protein